jgi:glycosyltransferase involved in cell wall biosynthesis
VKALSQPLEDSESEIGNRSQAAMHGGPGEKSENRLPGEGNSAGSCPSVSVVIPTRNRVALLQEAITSVQCQTLFTWELIVVDDTSQDGTWEWLLALEDPRIQALRLARHSERSAARNTGLRHVRSEYVLFLDDDDRLLPMALDRLLAPLRSRPDAVASIGARIVFKGSGQRRRLPHTRIHLSRSVWANVVLGWVPAQGQCLFRVKLLRSCGAYNESVSLCEDYELWLRVARLGEALLIPEAVLENRTHPSRISTADSDLALERIRDEAVSRLAGVEHEEALRIVRTSSVLRVADGLYSDGRFAGALRAYIKACRYAPLAVWSRSGTGLRMVIQMARSAIGLVLGPHVIETLRKLKESGRRHP